MTTNAIETFLQRRKKFAPVNYRAEAIRFIAMLGAMGALIIVIAVIS